MSTKDDAGIGFSSDNSDPATIITFSVTSTAVIGAVLYGFIRFRHSPPFTDLPVFLYCLVLTLLIFYEIWLMVNYTNNNYNVSALQNMHDCPYSFITNNIGASCLLALPALVLLIDREYVWWNRCMIGFLTGWL